MCGAETVEVSTFRAHFAREPNEENTDEHGRMLSDNVFGTQAEDAMRRDFTVNALFYDPVKEEVWDYVHGLKDLKAKKLVMIGDPATRYREDPVRMLRAARLGAKLGLEIDAKTKEPIRDLRHLLENVPQARLFEEILKLLLSGNAVECVRVLRELNLHHGLLPLLDTALDDPETGPFAMAALRATDERLAADKPVSPAFLLAALLWGRVEKNLKKYEEKGQPTIPALHSAMHEALDAQRDSLAIPRRFDATMKELWLMQPRFLQRGGQRPYRLLEHPRFRAAYDFFALRAASANAPQEAAKWWERFQEAGADEREEMLVSEESGPKKKRRRRRGKRKEDLPPPPRTKGNRERGGARGDRARIEPRRPGGARAPRLRRPRGAGADQGPRALEAASHGAGGIRRPAGLRECLRAGGNVAGTASAAGRVARHRARARPRARHSQRAAHTGPGHHPLRRSRDRRARSLHSASARTSATSS